MKITGQIHCLRHQTNQGSVKPLQPSAFVYSLILMGEEITLINSGPLGSEKNLFAYIRKIGRKLSDIKTLVLTHSDFDHASAAQRIKIRTNCRVVAHYSEKVAIENSIWNKSHSTSGCNAFKVDHIVDGSESFIFGIDYEIQLINTPGYSEGSVSLYFPNQKLLYTGRTVSGYPSEEPKSKVAIARSIRTLQKYFPAEILISANHNIVNGILDIRAFLRNQKDSIRTIKKEINQQCHENKFEFANMEQVG